MRFFCESSTNMAAVTSRASQELQVKITFGSDILPSPLRIKRLTAGTSADWHLKLRSDHVSCSMPEKLCQVGPTFGWTWIKSFCYNFQPFFLAKTFSTQCSGCTVDYVVPSPLCAQYLNPYDSTDSYMQNNYGFLNVKESQLKQWEFILSRVGFGSKRSYSK